MPLCRSGHLLAAAVLQSPATYMNAGQNVTDKAKLAYCLSFAMLHVQTPVEDAQLAV